MPMTLHAAFVPTALQMLGVTKTLVRKAREWGEANDASESEILAWSLTEDMLPFAYQVKSVRVHTDGAIAGVRAGQFSPDFAAPPASFGGLIEQLDGAIAALEALEESEMESWIGRDMAFDIPDRVHLDFAAEDFLLSFSQPNYFFHASTAYDILRMKGVKIGKPDWLGAMRIKTG